MITFIETPAIKTAKLKLFSLAEAKRVPSSILFTAVDGGHGLFLALQLAKYMVCDKPSHNQPCDTCVSCKQFDNFNYPDLHLSFPFINTKSSGKDTNCVIFRNIFSNELKQNPFLTKEKWMNLLDTANKQITINVAEAKAIYAALSMKSFTHKPRIVLVWQPELLHKSAANKLLKIIEEPGSNVYFFLISHRPEVVLNTILSRCVVFKVPTISDDEMLQALISAGFNERELRPLVLTANGSVGYVIDAIKNVGQRDKTVGLLVQWLRSIFTNRPTMIIQTSETIAALSKEDLKVFLDLANSLFRESLLEKSDAASKINFRHDDFSLSKFSPYINTRQSERILEIVEKCKTDIARNANTKVALLSTSLALTEYIRKA